MARFGTTFVRGRRRRHEPARAHAPAEQTRPGDAEHLAAAVWWLGFSPDGAGGRTAVRSYERRPARRLLGVGRVRLGRTAVRPDIGVACRRFRYIMLFVFLLFRSCLLGCRPPRARSWRRMRPPMAGLRCRHDRAGWNGASHAHARPGGAPRPAMSEGQPAP